MSIVFLLKQHKNSKKPLKTLVSRVENGC